ncbi:MAG: hypothetical protein E6K32_19880 [Gammaproteobacteria bacterium]|nr:MAG: hypothetical protein E6K32_19880 [Gammaproteobacteria bacterium]
MSETLKAAVHAAILRMLGPLVRLLLAVGIGVGDFMALVKVVYVRAARDVGREKRGELRPNASRIAVVTGLTRGDVAAILAARAATCRAGPLGMVERSGLSDTPGRPGSIAHFGLAALFHGARQALQQ